MTQKLWYVTRDVEPIYVLAEDEGDAETIATRVESFDSFAATEVTDAELLTLSQNEQFGAGYIPWGDSLEDAPPDLPLHLVAQELLQRRKAEAEAKALYDANLKLFPDVDPKPLEIEPDEEKE